MVNHPRRSVSGRTSSHTRTFDEIPKSGFGVLKHLVATRFQEMCNGDSVGSGLFRTAVTKDEMWACYLAAFPEGTNPIEKKRTHHDCSCCRQFIRAVGNAVTIVNGKLFTVWDKDFFDDPVYGPVARAMSALVRSKPIEGPFFHVEGIAGTDRTYQDGEAGVKTWEHFFVGIPNSRVCSGKDIGPRLSEAKAQHDVLLRSLNEITVDAVDTVLELIGQNSLYRGEEHRHAVSAFKQAKTSFDKVNEGEAYPGENHIRSRDNFVWTAIGELAPSVSKIRNTAIGTLLVALSEGQDMEAAVGAFEAMVAPANYKRPTALVTKAMVDKAKAKLQELGLTSALERRYAQLTDISVNNVLFVDRSARQMLRHRTGDVFDEIATSPSLKPKTFDRVDEIPIDRFLAEVLPHATSLELLVENRHIGNFVSLVAPVYPDSGLLFKWPNRFSWSYNGDFADSIRERVKRAGGNVTGELCCRLAWFNHDDLDFHMIEPNGFEIYFSYKGRLSPNGGMLDVDMNAGYGHTREPVENIFYQSAAQMREGIYRLFVHQFNNRDATDPGFEVEIDWRGDIHHFAYPKAVRRDERIVVADMQYTKANGIEFLHSLPSTTIARKAWELDTQAFHRVNVAILSPNHWDNYGSLSRVVGNRHYFFMLDGCQNDGTARGFYNEFLNGKLDEHRKVFEMVGARMRTDETAEQLSGLGFSTTQRNHVVVRVGGTFTRVLRITF